MWDSATGTFHGNQKNTNGTYAYKTIAGFDPNKAWRLDFDSKINSCDWSAGLTVGLFGSQIRYPWGAIEDQSISDGGHGTALVTNGTGAGVFSPGWSSGTWYHTVMEYNAGTDQVSMNITNRSTGILFQSQTQTVMSFPADTINFGVSRVHMGGNPPGASASATVDYNPDNVVFSQAIPEPSTLLLLGIGAIGLLGYAWRRRRRTA